MTDKEQIKEMTCIIKFTIETGYQTRNNTFKGFSFNDCAQELCDAGYHKTIWHKVADGDLPEYCKVVLVAMHFYNTIVYRLASLHISEDNGCPEENIFWSIQSDFPTSQDDIIAWTELPEYKE